MQNDLKAARHSRRFLRRSDAATYITERYGFPCSGQVGRDRWRPGLPQGGPVSGLRAERVGPVGGSAHRASAALDLGSRSGLSPWAHDIRILGS